MQKQTEAEILSVYHVNTDRPMRIGDAIVFDELHRSGVYTRVMERREQVKAILADPKAYEKVPLDHHTDVALRELALEEVRQKEFPCYPSRMACLYVSDSLEAALKWADYFIRLGRPTYAVVRLEVRGRCFAGDALNCFDGTPNQAENLRMARRYWQNLPNGEGAPIIEMLVDGDIRVAEIIQSYEQKQA